MPAFSFYKSWKVLNADSTKSPKSMNELWMNYLLNHPKMQAKETKLFAKEEQYSIFSDLLKKNLNKAWYYI